MSRDRSISVEAVVADAERPAVIAAGQQLHECLTEASGQTWQIAVRFCASAAAVASRQRPTLVILSLMPDLRRDDEAISQTEARWREALGALMPRVPSVFLCTLFRHVPATATRDGLAACTALRERIRRLNLLAAELSHDTGALVLDIDRVFAHLGARALKTGYSLAGPRAAEAAGYTIASGVLAGALEELVPPDLRQRARQLRGEPWGIAPYIRRRLLKRRSLDGAPHERA